MEPEGMWRKRLKEWLGIAKDLIAVLGMLALLLTSFSRLPVVVRAILCCISAGLLIYFFVRRSRQHARAARDRQLIFVVAVAPLTTAPDPLLWTEKIVRALRQSGIDNIRVVCLEHAVSEAQGSQVARTKGSQRGADMVVWGYVGQNDLAADVTIYIEVLNPMHRLSPLVKTNWSTSVPIEDVKSYRFQAGLSEELCDITRLVSALISYEGGHYAAAVTTLTLVLETQPMPITHLGVLHLVRGNAYARLNCLDEARRDLDEAVLLCPDMRAALLARGAVYFLSGDIDFALEDYAQAIAAPVNSEDRMLLEHPEASPYYTRGVSFLRISDPQRAIADLTTAIELDSTHYFAYLNRGWAYLLLQDYPQALRDFDCCISIGPNKYQAYNSRGIVHRWMGNESKALRDYQTAIRVGNDPNCYYNRALIRHARGQDWMALRDLERTLSLNPKHSGVYILRALLTLTAAEKTQTSDHTVLQSAIADFTQAIEISPGRVEAYRGRAVAYRYLGAEQSAIDDEAMVCSLMEAGKDASVVVSTHDLKEVLLYFAREEADH